MDKYFPAHDVRDFEEGIGHEANIAGQLNRLEKQTHMLGEAISRAGVRLAPILRPEAPELARDEGDMNDSPPMSDVANTLSRINRVLQRHFDDLTAIVDRSEA